MESDLRFVALSRLLIGVVLVATTELVSSPLANYAGISCYQLSFGADISGVLT